MLDIRQSLAPTMFWLIITRSSVALGTPESHSNDGALQEANEFLLRADRLAREGRPEAATTPTERACAIIEERLGGESVELARCLDDLGSRLREQGKPRESDAPIRRALAIRERMLGPDHLDVADSLQSLGLLLLEDGRYAEAKTVHERALAIRERQLGPNAPEVAESLDDLGLVNRQQGSLEESKVLHDRALAIRLDVLGPRHLDVATSLGNLAALHRTRGEYEAAEPLYKEALEIREESLGPTHPDVATSLSNLALLYTKSGEFSKAESLLERALEIWESTRRPDHPDIATGLNNLAGLYARQGANHKAEPLMERVLEIDEKTFGPRHPRTAASLNNLAALYQAQGAHDKAAPLFERCIAIHEESLGPDHPRVSFGLVGLALSRNAQGRHEEAVLLLERALDLRKRAFGTDHPLVASSMNFLAIALEARGSFEEARPLYESALDIRRRTVGPAHPDVAQSLTNLGGVNHSLGNEKEAEELYRRALAIYTASLGPNHFNLSVTLNKLARLLVEHERFDAAVEARGRALDIEREHIGWGVLHGEERRRLDQARRVSGSLDSTISAHLQAAPDHAPSAELAVTTLLRRKGIILELGARGNDVIRRSLPSEHRAKLDELVSVRDRYAALSRRGSQQRSPEEHARALADLQETQHRLWREISGHSPIANPLAGTFTVSDIQRALPPNGVLVEYVRYRPIHAARHPDTTPEHRYGAYVVSPDDIEGFDLGPAEDIEKDAADLRRALMLRSEIPESLYERIISPLSSRLEGTDEIFIAPDGALGLVPFAALFDGDGYLVERYSINTLSTGRDLLNLWDTGVDAEPTVLIVANPSGAELPGTEIEAEGIERLLPGSAVLEGEAATEGRVTREQRPWLMHIATHGFFDRRGARASAESSSDPSMASRRPSTMKSWEDPKYNPMMHAGLLLAPDEDDGESTMDGRLSAYEISGWDLRGTELVTLSACGTALGELEASEGALGIQRAFAMAGAQTRVVSLWNIGDTGTATLMEAYYRKLLAGKGRGEAMREVQLEMLRGAEHRHPKDWASFVVVGDWTPLSPDRLPKPAVPTPGDSTNGCGCHRASIGAGAAPLPSFSAGWIFLLLLRRRTTHAGHADITG